MCALTPVPRSSVLLRIMGLSPEDPGGTEGQGRRAGAGGRQPQGSRVLSGGESVPCRVRHTWTMKLGELPAARPARSLALSHGQGPRSV